MDIKRTLYKKMTLLLLLCIAFYAFSNVQAAQLPIDRSSESVNDDLRSCFDSNESFGLPPKTILADVPVSCREFDMQLYVDCVSLETHIDSDGYPDAVVPYGVLLDVMNTVIQPNLDKRNNASLWLNGALPGLFQARDLYCPSREVGAFMQKTTIPVGAEVILLGDLHGNNDGLIDVVKQLQQDGYLDKNLKLIKSNVYLIFLGDMVDYGKRGTETLFMALQLQERNPDRVSLCRGNHEQFSLFSKSFSREIQERYQLDDQDLQEFNVNMATLCSTLPFAIFLEIQDCPKAGFALCCHGGVPDGDKTLAWIKDFLDQSNSCRFASLDFDSFFGDKVCGFNWNDVSGKDTLTLKERYSRTPGHSASEYCKTHTLQELADACLPLIRILLRAHQEMCEPIKMSVPGVHYPVSPFMFYHDQFNETTGSYLVRKNPLTPRFYLPEEYRSVIETVLSRNGFPKPLVTTDGLYAHGYSIEFLKKLFNAPFFVATFSNAGKIRDSFYNGCGILTVGKSWEKSVLRAIILPAR